MGDVTDIGCSEGVVTGREGKSDGCVTLRVESCAGQLVAVITDSNSAGGGKAIFTGDGDTESCLRASGLIAAFHGQLGLGSNSCPILNGEGQRGRGQCDDDCCNQLKPQTAADHTSHVHLLQISRKSLCIVRLPKRRTPL